MHKIHVDTTLSFTIIKYTCIFLKLKCIKMYSHKQASIAPLPVDRNVNKGKDAV